MARWVWLSALAVAAPVAAQEVPATQPGVAPTATRPAATQPADAARPGTQPATRPAPLTAAEAEAALQWLQRLRAGGRAAQAEAESAALTALHPELVEIWRLRAAGLVARSAAVRSPAERWQLLRAAIDLLRDDAIPHNPVAAAIHADLRQLFAEKIAAVGDPDHWHAKLAHALEWEEVLGVPSADTAEAAAALRRIAEAPADLPSLLEAHPDVEPLLAELASLGHRPDARLLRRCGRLLMLQRSTDAPLLGLEPARLRDTAARRLIELLHDEAQRPALQALLHHVRRRTLQERYRMRPELMLALTERFGPLDWRHASAHALYWSVLGEQITPPAEIGSPSAVELPAAALAALHDLAHRGRLVLDPVSGRIDLLPDPRFLPALERALAAAAGAPPIAVAAGGEPARQSFLAFATVQAYLYGDRADAERFCATMRESPSVAALATTTQSAPSATQPDAAPVAAPATQPAAAAIEDFVASHMFDAAAAQVAPRVRVEMLLTRAWLQGMGSDRPDVARRFTALAEHVHESWAQRRVEHGAAGAASDEPMPSFDDLVLESFLAVMRQPQIDPRVRARVWANATVELRQEAFDALQETLRNHAAAAGFDPARAFPEPVGMQAHRRAEAAAVAAAP